MKKKALWILVIAAVIATLIIVFWDIVKTVDSSVWIGIGIALALSAILMWISSRVINKKDHFSGFSS
jgi:hypothetical protein